MARITSDRRANPTAWPRWEEPEVAAALSPRAATHGDALLVEEDFVRNSEVDGVVFDDRDWIAGYRAAERALFVGDRTAHGAQMGKEKAVVESK